MLFGSILSPIIADLDQSRLNSSLAELGPAQPQLVVFSLQKKLLGALPYVVLVPNVLRKSHVFCTVLTIDPSSAFNVLSPFVNWSRPLIKVDNLDLVSEVKCFVSLVGLGLEIILVFLESWGAGQIFFAKVQ